MDEGLEQVDGWWRCTACAAVGDKPEKVICDIETTRKKLARIGRFKGKEPGRMTELHYVLQAVRLKGPCLTSEVSRVRQTPTEKTMRSLRELQQRQLIARQRPLGVGVGTFESTWIAEVRS